VPSSSFDLGQADTQAHRRQDDGLARIDLVAALQGCHGKPIGQHVMTDKVSFGLACTTADKAMVAAANQKKSSLTAPK